jgi:hypothetical protein
MIIGINITTKTAKQQELLVRKREARAYWQGAYHSVLYDGVTQMVEDNAGSRFFDIKSEESFNKDGSVTNAIIFTFHGLVNVSKKELRTKIKEFVEKQMEDILN